MLGSYGLRGKGAKPAERMTYSFSWSGPVQVWQVAQHIALRGAR